MANTFQVHKPFRANIPGKVIESVFPVKLHILTLSIHLLLITKFKFCAAFKVSCAGKLINTYHIQQMANILSNTHFFIYM